MSYVMAAPGMLAAAATDVAAVGSTVSAAHMAAAPPTIAVIPAAADEVSAGIAHLFSRCGQDYHALAGQAAAFNEQFVQHLNSSAGSYAAAEAANAGSLLHVNASAASNVGTIAAAFPAQLSDALTGFWNILPTQAQIYLSVLYNVAYAWVLVANEAVVLAQVILNQAILQIAQMLSQMGAMIPL
jgi:PE family